MALLIPAFTDDLTYPFSSLRMLLNSLAGPGIIRPGDMLVTPAAGLQVQIAAGAALVQQTVAPEDTFLKGLYMEINDASTNPVNTILAPVSNPRIDQIILRIYDVKEQVLGGSSKGQFEWLQGSETAGAQVSNPAGAGYLAGAAASLDNSLRLAYVLQTVGEVSIPGGNIVNLAPVASPFLLRAPAAVAANSTLTIGQSAIVAPGTTQTLPAPQSGALVEIAANSSVTGATPVTISYNAGLGTGKIFGGGVATAGVSSFVLGTPGASVILQADGTNWNFASGQQDTGWVAIPAAGGATSAAQARLTGGYVLLRGSFTQISTPQATWGTVPSGLRPAQAWAQPPGQSMFVSTGGVVTSWVSQSSLPVDGVVYSVV